MITLFVVLFALGSPHISVEESRFLTVTKQAAELPDHRPELILPNAIAAFANETDEYPSELLLALAWGESRFEPNAGNRIYCGVMQTARTASPLACDDAYSGYRAGVDELRELASDRRTHGDLELVLLYRACGNAAFDGTCTKHAWVRSALRRARRLGMRNVRGLS